MNPKELKTWREKQSLTQGELAELLGVRLNTVYRWEAGMRQIPPFLHLALKWLDKKGGKLEHGRENEK